MANGNGTKTPKPNGSKKDEMRKKLLGAGLAKGAADTIIARKKKIKSILEEM